MSNGTGPGRKRDPHLDGAIIEATLALLGEVGFSALSMEGIAARAGVGKSTVYRRYPSKLEAVSAAMGALAVDPEVPDTGDTFEDVVLFMTSKWVALMEPPGATLLGTFIVQATSHPELFAEFRRVMLVPRLTPLRKLLQRGKDRGELRPDLDLAAAIDLIVGPVLVSLVTRGDPDPGLLESRLGLVWKAFSDQLTAKP